MSFRPDPPINRVGDRSAEHSATDPWGRALVRVSRDAWPRLVIAVHAEQVQVSSRSRLENDCRQYRRHPILLLEICGSGVPILAIESPGVPQLGHQYALDLFARRLDMRCTTSLGASVPPAYVSSPSYANEPFLSPSVPAIAVGMAGSFVRTLFMAAAADIWRVPPGACVTSNGIVMHAPTRNRARYGELASAVARYAPAAVQLWGCSGRTECTAGSHVAPHEAAAAQIRSPTAGRPYAYGVDTRASWRLIDTVNAASPPRAPRCMSATASLPSAGAFFPAHPSPRGGGVTASSPTCFTSVSGSPSLTACLNPFSAAPKSGPM